MSSRCHRSTFCRKSTTNSSNSCRRASFFIMTLSYRCVLHANTSSTSPSEKPTRKMPSMRAGNGSVVRYARKNRLDTVPSRKNGSGVLCVLRYTPFTALRDAHPEAAVAAEPSAPALRATSEDDFEESGSACVSAVRPSRSALLNASRYRRIVVFQQLATSNL
ncbi:hypothetical protein, conserved [Leishmania tarentolae]|uniref:Uncharacterized protein n=1 Tax=Leishmania tarentolae TaxID=5689 RepID=A0A640K7E0_LEITA|nr:hypothetical protein, conserved [Leishmania tarentolae]